MESANTTILLIDDDPEVRDGVGRLLRSAGWKTAAFASAMEYLAAPPLSDAGCIVLDISMPEMTGPELHARMREHDDPLPVVYLSGRCDVPTSVQAMKLGAMDVLEKPVDADALLEAVGDAVQRHRQACLRRQGHAGLRARLATLSAREREVLDHVIVGKLNKQIAGDLGISLKTVKAHRGRVTAKLQVRSVAELVRLCNEIGLGQ